ncbi:MAG: peptidoglycan DD-metalloendopeptidase family protein [Clostridiales bacterium]
MNKKNTIILFIVLCFMLSFSVNAFGADIKDLESSKDEVTNKIDGTKEKLEGVKEEKTATQEDLSKINDKIGVLQNDISKLQTDLAAAENNLEKQEAEYKIIENNLLSSQEYMKGRVHNIYVNGDISYWDVIFSASSAQDFLSSFVFCEKIVEQDKENINTIQENKRLAEAKLAELKATKAKIATLKSSKENQETQFAAESQTKEAVVADLSQDENYLEEQIQQMAAESANIEASIQSYYAEQAAKAAEAAKLAAQEEAQAQTPAADGTTTDNSENSGGTTNQGNGNSSPEYSGTGSMRWPTAVQGRISSPYGPRSRGMHTGMDIACPYGTPVLAADSGKVIMVKRLTYSYGQYVIIDHGNSTSTLYAHMSSINVSVGQTVSKGQQVGAVGSTGNSTGNHLHFEVRINGRHTNPAGYIS